NAGYIKSILAPLNHIPVMPTGGINAENIKDYQKAGAVAFGIGSWLVNSNETVTETYLQSLQMKARSLKEAIELTE
ncbi:MAG: 2-dehydro-3-deoxyphosphogluconate aldolase, partial [Bacteroidota bacterium]|nr:2-dehydro-3-deoxyphosphogluconate aldolase [Bacteroidota bacterium]